MTNNKKLPSIGDKIMVYEQDSSNPIQAKVLKKRVSVHDGKTFFFIRTSSGEEWRSEDAIITSIID